MHEKKNTAKRRSALRIMGSLIGLVKPLLHIMMAAIILGTMGYLCAIFLTILAGQVIVHGLLTGAAGTSLSVQNMWLVHTPVKTILTVMIVIAVLRGILHYAEQYCNHFIAFKLLAIIRHKVFAALRKLCPAKLEGRDKGNLISIITTDIELLEVFYAHTISPIAIAALTSLIMVCFIGRYHVLAGLLALAAYLTVGVVIPMWNGKRGSQKGMEFRTGFGELNSFVLDSLRGLDETIQYGQGEKRKEQMSERSKELASVQENLSRMEGSQRSVTNMVILLASFGMLALTIYLYTKGGIGFEGVLTCTIAMMGSFGPVVALSSLSNNLNQTLASGERVLSLLEEAPLVEEIPGDTASGGDHAFAGAEAQNVTFAYEDETILDQYSLKLEPGKITGIHGASGSGKSTILKSLIRQLKLVGGAVWLDNTSMERMTDKEISRKMAVVMTERIHPELMTCEDVVATGRYPYTGTLGILGAEDHEKVKSAMNLVHAWELRDRDFSAISDGQRQRILLARAICQEPEVIVLDEPTSFLDIRHKLELLAILKQMVHEKHVAVLMSLHELDLAQKVSDLVICVHGDQIERMGVPEEIFTDEYIHHLYGVTTGSYNAAFGCLELDAPKGEPEVFVIAGGGSGIPVFRQLQRKGIPFAVGVLPENDVDYQVARALSEHVISEQAFEEISEEKVQEALAVMRRCSHVICAVSRFGTINRRCEELKKEAEQMGLLQ